MLRPGGHTRVFLALAAVLVHAVALAGTAWRLGGIDAYAFRSTDSAEYLELARSLARSGTYERQGVADTWRVPGYPLFLAVVIRLAGDSTKALVLGQHALSILNLWLFHLGASMLLSRRSAALVTILWMLDPFRIYYCGWLLAETLFITWLLLAGIVWLRCRDRTGAPGGVALLGLLLGTAMLTRPIGVFLPPLAAVGLFVRGRQAVTAGRALREATICLAAALLVAAPWLGRNLATSGRLALSHQSGVSLAYFKVVEVLLWERGRTADRFDPAIVTPILEDMDARLVRRWEREHGPLTAEQKTELRWSNIIYGNIRAVPPVEVSRTLWRIGIEMLAARPAATVACFAARAVSLVTYPAAIGLWPPRNAGAAPFATLLGVTRPQAARALAVALGAAFAVLAAAALLRVSIAVWRRRRLAVWFAIWTALGLVAMTVPFEDPRFREPLVPMLLLAAFAGGAGRERVDAGRKRQTPPDSSTQEAHGIRPSTSGGTESIGAG